MAHGDTPRNGDARSGVVPWGQFRNRMDKRRKLRRYERKDYTQLVDFPVEIVGRDGLVRSYSFDESVRLYQRRIASAQARYLDGEVIDAEVVHCRQRIGQLRRSYFARYGWSALRVGDRPGLLAGEFAADVSAFLRGVLADTVAAGEGAEKVSFALVEDEEYHQLYFVRREDAPDAEPWLLYLFRFGMTAGCPGRDAFFHNLKLLQAVSASEDSVERLLGFHHTIDCGLILTGRDADDAALESPAQDVEWLHFDAVDDDPLQAAFLAMRRGRLPDALSRFSESYEAQPYRRAAYVGAGVVADQLGAFEAAEMAALMGVRYLRGDPLLLHHLALVYLRTARPAAARAALDSMAPRDQAVGAARLLRGLVDIQAGRWVSGVRHTWTAARQVAGDDPDLADAARRVLAPMSWVLATVAAGGVTALLPLLLFVAGRSLPPLVQGIAALGGIAAALAAIALGGRAIRALLRKPSGVGLRLANPVVFRGAGGRWVDET